MSSSLAGGFFTISATWKAYIYIYIYTHTHTYLVDSINISPSFSSLRDITLFYFFFFLYTYRFFSTLQSFVLCLLSISVKISALLGQGSLSVLLTKVS